MLYRRLISFTSQFKSKNEWTRVVWNIEHRLSFALNKRKVNPGENERHQRTGWRCWTGFTKLFATHRCKNGDKTKERNQEILKFTQVKTCWRFHSHEMTWKQRSGSKRSLGEAAQRIYLFIYFLHAPWVMHLLSLFPSSCHAGVITISFLHSKVCLCSRNSSLPPLDQAAWHSISVPQRIKSCMRGSSDPHCFHKGCSDSHQRTQWIAGPLDSATWVSWEDFGSCWRWQHVELH